MLAVVTTDKHDNVMVRQELRASIDAYGDGTGPYCGSFLRAVYANDLVEAATRADPFNSVALSAIVMYVLDHVPSEARGSYEKVDAWMAKHRDPSPGTASGLSAEEILRLVHEGVACVHNFRSDGVAEDGTPRATCVKCGTVMYWREPQ